MEAVKVHKIYCREKALKIKKILFFLFLAVLPIFLCSCLEEYHVVKKTDSGFEIRLIYSISKSVVKSVYEEEGRDVLKDLEAEIHKEYGKDVQVDRDQKNDAHLITASFFASSESSKQIKLMLPQIQGNKMIIPLDYQREYDEESDQNFSSPYFTPKYHLIIDKFSIDNLKSVEFRRKSGKTIDVNFTEKDELYFISIPLKWLYFKDPYVEAILTVEETSQKCSEKFVYSNEFEICIPICKKNEILYWRPMDEACGYRDFPDTCVLLPEHSHKTSFQLKAVTDGKVDIVNNFSWECDFGYSRDRDEYECTKWPKGAHMSDKCWISTIDTLELKRKHPYIKNIIKESAMDDYEISLAEAVRLFRGVLSEKIEVNIGGVYETYSRVKVPIKEKSENTSLGPFSGCWECPPKTVYNYKNHECVAK